MTSPIFRCGHDRTPENSHIAAGGARCRECWLAGKRRWRERAREKVEKQRMMRWPILLPPPKEEPLTPEALGSRNLLIAYARYYENHVKNRAA